MQPTLFSPPISPLLSSSTLSLLLFPIACPTYPCFCILFSSLIVDPTGSIILYALNTIIFSFAVGRSAGLPVVAGREEMYAVLNDMAKETDAHAKQQAAAMGMV